jgi:hypothetical protein
MTNNGPHQNRRAGWYIRLLLLVAGFCWGPCWCIANNDAGHFSENVNLALRRTAHLLMMAQGDTASHIPPVNQTDSNTFSVRIDNILKYDKLPLILQESLRQQHITRGYNVSVFRCDSNVIQLGYHFEDLGRPGGVACLNRSHDLQCYTLQIRFLQEKAATTNNSAGWWALTAGGLMAATGFIAWKRKRPRLPIPAPEAGTRFGQSRFDADNLTLTVAGSSQQLTFREAKLLRLFLAHPNQVLERHFILQSVWEDEGVTVGRSVDVFVSRLRKMLSADPLLKITAIHGIGYRFEIQS